MTSQLLIHSHIRGGGGGKRCDQSIARFCDVKCYGEKERV